MRQKCAISTCPIMHKHDVIHKTGSRQYTALSSEKDVRDDYISNSSYTSQSIAVVTTGPVYLFIARQARNASKFNRLPLYPGVLTDRLSNDYVHNSLRTFTKFVCWSQMWLLRRLLFERQTGSSLPILEMCGFRFWQFSGFGDHIFQQISTKSHIRIKFSNADFVFNAE